MLLCLSVARDDFADTNLDVCNNFGKVLDDKNPIESTDMTVRTCLVQLLKVEEYFEIHL